MKQPKVKFEIAGLKQISAELKALGQDVEKEMRAAMRVAGREMRAEAQARVPVRSGGLKQSIALRTVKDTPGQIIMLVTAGRIRGKGFHAHLVEFGHRIVTPKLKKLVGFVSPRPFFRPAYDLVAPKIPEKMGEIMAAKLAKFKRAAERAARQKVNGG